MHNVEELQQLQHCCYKIIDISYEIFYALALCMHLRRLLNYNY